MSAYYNEIDPFAAAWLRELIKCGHIADGDVDERSIEDVTPDDLKRYTQCHFFAGIGVWSYALRQSGWPDDRQVWTGSCPCQPFSAAGKGAGFTDERHLWPSWFHLIDECRPRVIFGEQVASKDGLNWLDLVHTDMEGAGYAFGAFDLCAAGVGAPHIRQRLFFVGHAFNQSRERDAREVSSAQARLNGAGLAIDGGLPVGLGDASAGVGVAQGDTDNAGSQGRRVLGATAGRDSAGELPARTTSVSREPDELGDAANDRCEVRGYLHGELHGQGLGEGCRPMPTNGFWRDAHWLPCIDGKARPVEPGTFPLAHGAPARVGRLRGYGNAINAEVAKTFIEAYLSL